MAIDANEIPPGIILLEEEKDDCPDGDDDDLDMFVFVVVVFVGVVTLDEKTLRMACPISSSEDCTLDEKATDFAFGLGLVGFRSVPPVVMDD